MKRRLIPIIAFLLIAFGVLIDRVATLTLERAGAAVADTATPAAATPVTVSATSVASVPSTSAASIDAATERAYATTGPSVVYVESVGIGSGSGVIYDVNGDIVTNNHVVEGATQLSVTLNDGRTYAATVVGTDKTDDLAVIRIHASGLTPARFASAGMYRVAQAVLAIGSPLGLKQSVTFGLVSGLHRVEREPNGSYIPDAIQTSAPINPGNSGGALTTLDGIVVGIPTLEQTSSQSGETTQSIGFAVPSERVVLVAKQIIATGHVEHTGRAYLGIAPSDASSQSNSSSGFGNGGGASIDGALVSDVASSGPAGRAGVRQGDVITNVNGHSITSAEDLLTILASKKPGETVNLKLDRNGTSLSVKVRLGELPA